MNRYRVDRADSARVPCGMNSILYIGDSLRAARRAYDDAELNRDVWNTRRAGFGVILSRWSDSARDYVPMQTKGVE